MNSLLYASFQLWHPKEILTSRFRHSNRLILHQDLTLWNMNHWSKAFNDQNAGLEKIIDALFCCY